MAAAREKDRQECIRAEIDAVDATEQSAEPPHESGMPVGKPPARRGGRVARRRRFRRKSVHGDRDQRDRRRPRDERCPPAAQAEHQHERRREQHGENLTDEETVGVERGAESDPLRHPLPHRGRHDGLHDRYAGRHDDRRRQQDREIGASAAQRRSGGDDREPADERALHAEVRDQQRTSERRQREHCRRNARQQPDLRRGEREIVADRREDWRYGENREPQPVAGEPEQRGFQPRHGRSGVGHRNGVVPASGEPRMYLTGMLASARSRSGSRLP